MGCARCDEALETLIGRGGVGCESPSVASRLRTDLCRITWYGEDPEGQAIAMKYW
jgi:hypothetical protein